MGESNFDLTRLNEKDFDWRNAGISCGGPPRQSTMRLRSVSVTMSIFYDCEMLVGRTSAGSNRIVEYRMKRSI